MPKLDYKEIYDAILLLKDSIHKSDQTKKIQTKLSVKAGSLPTSIRREVILLIRDIRDLDNTLEKISLRISKLENMLQSSILENFRRNISQENQLRESKRRLFLKQIVKKIKENGRPSIHPDINE